MFPTRRGVTIIELVAVALILGILSVYIAPRILTTSSDAKSRVNEHNKNQINSAVERYTLNEGNQPTTIDDLDHPNYLPDGIPSNPVNGVPYTLDPGTNRADDGS